MSSPAHAGVDFAQELLDSCPNTGKQAPFHASACEFVTLDSAGRPIDTANGNANAQPDAGRVQQSWQGAEQIGQSFSNCSGLSATSTIAQTTGKTYTTTTGWSAELELTLLPNVKLKIGVKSERSESNSTTLTLQKSSSVPPYYTSRWMLQEHVSVVQGAMKVTLPNRVSDPGNSQGGAHWIWYPGITVTLVTPDPVSGDEYALTSMQAPMSGQQIAACGNSNSAAESLVNKYGTEHGASASGFCATVPALWRNVRSEPCSAASGARQRFAFVPTDTAAGQRRSVIVNVETDSCLTADPRGVGQAVNATVCNADDPAQLWQPVATVGTTQYVNAATQLCLNAWADKPAPSYGLNQATCGGDATTTVAAQLWANTPQPFPARNLG